MTPGGLAYRDEGDPGNPVVVLLHGDGRGRNPWDDVVGMLAPWTRVIAPEPERGAPPGDVAASVRDLLEGLGITRCAVAGDGTGGLVAQILAIEGGVDAMVLVGSPALEGADAAFRALEVPALVVYGEDDPRLPATALAEWFAEVLPMASVALLPGHGDPLLRSAPETVAPLVFRWLRSRYLQVPHVHETGPVVVELGRRPGEESV
ncbi:MAG TPA: alpha/beta hydrolase [Actinomycetota bacterium]